MSKRVLIIINTLNVGGAETFIMKVFRSLDKNKMIFDFLVCEKEKGVYEEEVVSLGGHVYHGCYKVKNPFKNQYFIFKTVKDGRYKTIFVFSQHPIVALDLLAAKIGGAKKRVVRSTNSACGGKLSRVIAAITRPLMNMLITERIAPSKEAALWLFGKQILNKNKYTLLNNGLDLKTYTYNDLFRCQFREELSIKNELVVGHVGRFNFQKNHFFLINVFDVFHRKNPNSKLVLIGNGETKLQVVERVKELSLEDNVVFLDVRSDIPYCLSGFDVFLFPSLYEGMPNTVVEAQACGLPCLISDTITKDACITDLVVMQSLSESPQDWAVNLEKLIIRDIDRQSYGSVMRNHGYSIEDVCKKLYLILS